MKRKTPELRAQGAQIDAAARATPGRRHLEVVPEKTSAAKPLGLVSVVSPTHSIKMAGLKKVLEGKADVKNGVDGFVHAQMRPAQLLRAVEVVLKGELAAPRQLLGYFLSQKEKPEIGELSARQREILEMVVEGLRNAEIAGQLYLSESTIKQHLRAAYKVLGVRNRTQAAKTMREHAGGV